ncbi:hypothetical protein [Vibrio campbellii]|uniref:hypothetical protein n=1 Tax=Vibrio campbellii TaxID=680 RepID=UPI0005EE3D25|nr:hypothetical protein [Vibrio campbellii]
MQSRKIRLLLVGILLVTSWSTLATTEKYQLPSAEKNQTRTETSTQLSSISQSLELLRKQIHDLSINDQTLSEQLNNSLATLEDKVNTLERKSFQIQPNLSSKLVQKVDQLYEEKDFFSYADFAAIAITCVSVLITVVGLAIALLSFFGFKNIRKSTELTAQSIAEETAKMSIEPALEKQLSKLIDDGKLNKHLEEVVDGLILRDSTHRQKTKTDNIDWSELDWEETEDDAPLKKIKLT